MTLRLDGANFSHLVPKRGYKVSYKKILGANSCYTLDGTYHEDVLAYKAVIEIELMPMKPEQLSALIAAVENCNQATYYDTKVGEDVTKNAIVALSPASLVMNSPGKVYWSNGLQNGIVLTIEER